MFQICPGGIPGHFLGEEGIFEPNGEVTLVGVKEVPPGENNSKGL